MGEIYAGLARAGIEIPFPQRDLHFKSVRPEVAKALGERGTE
jgi:small-conductance mechanosensitive channel